MMLPHLFLALVPAQLPVGGEWMTDFNAWMQDEQWSPVIQIDDMNGDGTPDLASAYPYMGSTLGRSRIYLISGADGSRIDTWSGDPLADRMWGASLASISDLDGDGKRDLLVSDHLSNRVELRSSASGAVLDTVTDAGSTLKDFGLAIAVVDDLDGDGIEEFMVSDRSQDFGNLDNAGKVYLYSGATRALLQTFSTQSRDHFFGSGLSRFPDLDSDGIDDLAIGADGADGDHGQIYFYSSVSYQLLGTARGSVVNGPGTDKDGFGTTLTLVGDIDGDGKPDLAAPRYGDGNGDHGSVAILSSQGGVPLIIPGPAGSKGFGLTVDMGDLNRDGFDDLGVATEQNGPNGNAGLHLYSGADGSELGFVDHGTRPYQNMCAFRWPGGPQHAIAALRSTSTTPLERSEFRPYLVESGVEYSLSAAQPIQYQIDFPKAFGGYTYAVLASGSGVGTTSYGVDIPLVDDSLLQFTATPNNPLASALNWQGVLDSDGDALASFGPNPLIGPSSVGLYHLAVIALPGPNDLAELSSFAIPLVILP